MIGSSQYLSLLMSGHWGVPGWGHLKGPRFGGEKENQLWLGEVSDDNANDWLLVVVDVNT